MKAEKNSKKGIIIVVLIILIGLIIIKYSNNDQKSSNENVITGFELLASTDFKKEEILALGYPTLLDIGGAECIPCKAMAPVLKELNKELMGKAIIKFVDYWKYPHLASQFQFNVIPTQFFYDEHGELNRVHEGGITKEGILAIFKEMGYTFDE